jgi:hypothetical protein
MAFSIGWLVTVGIVLLGVGVVAGLIAQRREQRDEPADVDV